MTEPQGEQKAQTTQPPDEDRTARNIGVGCFTSFAGFWSGGMVAVLIGRVIAETRGMKPCEGLPVCDWQVYAGAGALIGAVSLPLLVLTRLRRRDVRREHS
jgi:hypothetical protein